MGLNIRDPRVAVLARGLAAQQGTTMTAVIFELLEKETKRRREEIPLHDRLQAIVEEAKALSKPGGHLMTKDEIDEMWGQ